MVMCFFPFRPSWVNILGTSYKIGAIIHVGFDEYLPVFAEIKSIFVFSSSIERVYFAAESLHTDKFCEEYRTYIVKTIVDPKLQLYPHRTLQYFLPLHFLKPVDSNNQAHILPKYDLHNYD
jgi:hypothetical protein